MNLQGLQKYFTNGKGVSVGTPNEATLYKLPQLNTAQITTASYNAGATTTSYAGTTPAIPFYLTDRNPDGIPFVKCEQAKGAGVDMTLLTFTKLPFIVANTTGASFGKLKLLTMPFGRFSYNGGSCIFTSVDWSRSDLTFVQTTATAGTVLGATGSGDFSVGTTGTTDATLSTTDVDIVASTAFLDPFVAGVGNNLATPGAVLNVPTEFDGSTTTTSGTAKSVNLNIIVDDADDTNADSHMILLTGFLRIYTSWLGDF